jgi:hypothetical protein
MVTSRSYGNFSKFTFLFWKNDFLDYVKNYNFFVREVQRNFRGYILIGMEMDILIQIGT